MQRSRWKLSKSIGRFAGDRRVLGALILTGLVLAAWSWLQEHPQHNPWAPLDLRDPPGWATQGKLTALKGDAKACSAVLERSDVRFTALEPIGDGACRRESRTRLDLFPFAPRRPDSTCAVAAGLELWLDREVQPAAQVLLGQRVARVEHLGTYSCRRMYGRDEGPWSEHATANAIDISGFVLADGSRVTVLRDWDGSDPEARFLHAVRDAACNIFATTLSPDYNAAHADHFHFDQADRWSGLCR